MIITAYAIGAASGVALTRRSGPVDPRPLPPAASSAPVAIVSSSAPPTAEPIADAATRRAPGSVPPRTEDLSPFPRSSVSVTESPTDLARERSLIDAARGTLAGGHPESALAIVKRHENGFPRGQLREDREALRILALLALRRNAEARAHERAFRKAYPESLFLTEIDAAMRETP